MKVEHRGGSLVIMYHAVTIVWGFVQPVESLNHYAVHLILM